MVVERLLALIRNHDPILRYALASALSNTGENLLRPDIRDALIFLASDRDEDVQFSAAWELAAWWEQTADSLLYLELIRIRSFNKNARLLDFIDTIGIEE